MDTTPEAQVNETIECEAATGDAAVLARVRGGETAAFELIMRRYNQRLFRIARSILRDDAEAQDVMQEAYVRAYFSLERFSGPERVGAWLARITINEALMRKRKQGRYTHLDADARVGGEDARTGGGYGASLSDDPEHHLANAQLRQLIEHAVDDLPQAFRTVFVLRAIEQLSVRETAACLDLAEATVKTRFHRARKLVRARLSEQLQAAQMDVYEFAGRRCDAVVSAVLGRIGGIPGDTGGVH